jgi:urease accessory protein
MPAKPSAGNTAPSSFLHLLQFSDGLFPAGGYAHSFGLETLVQSGRVQDAAGVATFLRAHLEYSAAPTDAVLVLAAQKAAQAQDLAGCLRLDQLTEALKIAAEAREASRQMGRQTLRILNDLARAPFVSRYTAQVEQGAASAHHPVVFGIAAAAMDWRPEETAGAFLYSTSALIVGASLRLLPLGQLAGQQILWGLTPLIASLSQSVQSATEDDIWSFAPEIEIAAMQHESLDARLFRS